MSRRQAIGLVLIFLLISSGRLLRDRLLIGPDRRWRDPLPGESLLPPLPPDRATESVPPPEGPFAVNRVSADTLCFLPGIGPVLADRIVAERARNPFQDQEDLQRVRGIGPALAAKISPQLIFTGSSTDYSNRLKIK